MEILLDWLEATIKVSYSQICGFISQCSYYGLDFHLYQA